LTTLIAVRAFALAEFAFSNQPALSSASFYLMRRIENADVAVLSGLADL
jgi:hypothetical protein